MFCAISSFAQVRISQVYGGGGNTSATYNQDFVEIFNAGTTAANIGGYTAQYASATGTVSWLLAGNIPAGTSLDPGKYFLIAVGAASGTVGIALPTADVVGPTTTNFSGSSGKVALVNNATLLSGAAGCASATVVDVIGFGSPNCSETAAFVTTGITTAQSIFRKSNGCVDANNNSIDFEILTVSPRNSSSAANNCSGGPVATIVASPNITGLSTTPGNPSAEGTFNVSGANLTGFPGNISVTAAANIEVSLTSGGTFTTSVNIPYASATLASTPVYARIAATAPAGAVNGTVTLAGGGDVDGAAVTVSGSVIVAEPTVQATNIIFSTIGNSSFDVNWTNGNGTSRLVVVKQTSVATVLPSDGTAYIAGANVGTGNRVVYSGTAAGPVNVTGLLGGTGYTVLVYEYNGSAGSNNYLTTPATANPNTTTTTGVSPNLAQINFTSVATPQYGASGTATRLPVMFYATVSGLSPNTTYRYINQAATATDFGSTNLGAGNPLLLDHTVTPMTFIYSSGPSVTSAGNFGLFETDASGSFTGAFGYVNTGNARFGVDSVVYPTIAVAEDVAPFTIQNRFALNLGIEILAFGTTPNSADSGTFIKGISSAAAGNVVGLWSTVDGNMGTQRPLAMTIVENITTTGATWPASFVPAYSESPGAWNTIIPNANANGVRLIQQFDIATGNVIGCNADADGIWPTGNVNTVNPGAGAAGLQISATDAPLNGGSCFSILPVRISSFAVQKAGNTTKISWTTEQELNSREFVIERSTDQRNWTVVATVAAAGNSNSPINYTTTDFTPAKGINFYRLRMVDIDSRAENSVTRSVLFGTGDVVLITPNPATAFATIYMGKNNNSVSQIFVTDMNGKLVEKINTADQTHIIQTARFSKGLYIIKVVTDGATSTHKLLVQ